jgi:regulator of RNase E activity RraA
MNPMHPITPKSRRAFFFAVAGLAAMAVSLTVLAASKVDAAEGRASMQSAAGAPPAAAYGNSPDTLLDAYRHVEVASVSDALEQLYGQRMYLSHRMQPLFPTRFTGFAVTVRMDKQENHDAHAVDGMLAAIDRGEKNSVYVMSVQDGADVAGIGGLMGTAMLARDFSGAIVDGAVRDTAYLKKIGFPVYATGIAPSTLVGHYRCAGTEIPVEIDGVTIHPGDVITADPDGVVIVPRARAAEVLALAQQLDFKEHSTYPLIEKTKSIEEAVKQFGRL